MPINTRKPKRKEKLVLAGSLCSGGSFPTIIKVNRCADEHQGCAKHAVKHGRLVGSMGGLVGHDIVVNSERQVYAREDYENPGHKWIAGDSVGSDGVRLFSAEHKNAIG